MTEETPDAETPAWRRNAPLAAGIVVLAGLGFAAWQWLLPEAPPEVSKPPAAAPATLPPPPPEPVIANPLETPPDASAAPTAADLESALTALAGADTVQSLFRLQDLPRRIVTTVDNLGRAQVSSSLWPVKPPAGEFTTDRSGEAVVIAAANYARYCEARRRARSRRHGRRRAGLPPALSAAAAVVRGPRLSRQVFQRSPGRRRSTCCSPRPSRPVRCACACPSSAPT